MFLFIKYFFFHNTLILNLKNNVKSFQVDARNIVPVRVAAAGDNNIRDLLKEFLTEFPLVIEHPHPPQNEAQVYYTLFLNH